MEYVSESPGFGGSWFWCVYHCVPPRKCFMNQCSSFNADFSGFFLTLSHGLKKPVQRLLQVEADGVCLFATWCLLALFYL